MGIGAGQEGGEKRGREERAARARARRGGREPRSAAPAPASCASRAAARRGPSRDGLARGLPLLLLPRPAAPPPRRAPPAGEWPRRAGGRRPVRHGRGAVPGAGARGRGAAGARGGAGNRAGVPGPWAGGPRSRGSRRAQTAGSQEGDQGAGRGLRSNSGRGRHAFASPVRTRPRTQRCPVPPRTRAPRTRRRSWIAGARSPTRRPGTALAWECLGGFSFSTSHRGN